jgi:hypothetical protein
LNLAENNFNGTLPADIGNLTGLELLNLSGNSLSGPIPDAIGDMQGLDVLNLSANALGGTVLPDPLATLDPALDLSLCGNTGGAFTYESMAVQTYVTTVDPDHNGACPA